MTSQSAEKLVAKLLARASSPRAKADEFLAYSDHEDARIRSAALAAVWELPCEGLLAAAIKTLKENDPEMQTGAAFALGRYIWSGLQIDEELDAEFGFVEDVSRADVERARSALLQALEAPGQSESVRHRALEALAYDPDPKLRQRIEQLWHVGGAEEKKLALACMGRAGLKEWRGEILEALNSQEDSMLETAIQAAGEACIDESESRLLDFATGTNEKLAMAAIWALRNVVHTKKARNTLESLAARGSREVKKMAKAALADADAVDVQFQPD